MSAARRLAATPSTVPRRRDAEGGAALLFTLLLLVLAVTAGGLIATSLAIEARTRRDDARRVRAAALLDSAVVEAIADLAVDPDSRGFLAHDFGGGEIESDVFAVSSTQRAIVARARYGAFERQATVEVVLETGGPRVLSWSPTGSF